MDRRNRVVKVSGADGEEYRLEDSLKLKKDALGHREMKSKRSSRLRVETEEISSRYYEDE